jgi:hypothetical protein
MGLSTITGGLEKAASPVKGIFLVHFRGIAGPDDVS